MIELPLSAFPRKTAAVTSAEAVFPASAILIQHKIR